MRFVRSLVVGLAVVVVGSVAPGRVQGQVVGFAPGVGSIPDGVSLNVTPVVSADRRYVRLSMIPQFQTIDGFSNFPIPAAVGGGGNGGHGLGGLGGLGGGGNGGGGLRNVGLGPADFAAWYPSLGVPREQVTVPLKPLKATGRSMKALPDPEIVPIKKTKPSATPAPAARP
jgi:hypothetical protein